MSVNCSYLYTSSGLRFQEGHITVDLSGLVRPDGRGTFPDGSVLRVVRKGHGRSRLDRFSSTKQDDGAVGEISLKDLRNMGVGEIPVTVRTEHGTFDHLSLDPAAAQGRQGRQAGEASRGGAAAYEQLSARERAALAATQIESLPYGEATEGSTERLRTALFNSPSLKAALKRNPDAWRHLNQDMVADLVDERPEEMMKVIRWSVQPVRDNSGWVADPDPYQAAAILQAVTLLEAAPIMIDTRDGNVVEGKIVESLGPELSPYLARAMRNEIAGTLSKGRQGDGRLTDTVFSLLSGESMNGQLHSQAGVGRVRDMVASAALVMAADRDDFRSNEVRNVGVDMLFAINALRGFPLPAKPDDAWFMGPELAPVEVLEPRVLEVFTRARTAATFDGLVTEYNGFKSTMEMLRSLGAPESFAEISWADGHLPISGGEKDAIAFCQARKAGWAPDHIGAAIASIAKQQVGMSTLSNPLREAATFARFGVLPETALKIIENGYTSNDLDRPRWVSGSGAAPTVSSSLANLLRSHGLEMSVIDNDGVERPLVTKPEDLVRIPRQDSANNHPLVTGWPPSTGEDSDLRVRLTHPKTGGELVLYENAFTAIKGSDRPEDGVYGVISLLRSSFPQDTQLRGQEIADRAFASELLASHTRALYFERSYSEPARYLDADTIYTIARAARHVYELEVVNPRNVGDLLRDTIAPDGTLETSARRSRLGIEVTIPEAAALCDKGNIDPQHTGQDDTRSATMHAFTTFHGSIGSPRTKAPSFDTVVTIGPRPDVDSMAAAALVSLAGLGVDLGNSGTVRSVVEAIDRSDRSNTDGWDPTTVAVRNGYGYRNLSELAADDPEVVGALGALMSDFKVDPDQRVTLMAEHLLRAASVTEEVVSPEVLRAVKQRRDDRSQAVEESTVMTYGGEGFDGIAVVASGHRFATGIGYERHPVVVAFNAEFPNRDGQTYRKFTVARYNTDIPMDMKSLSDALNAAELAAGNPAMRRSDDGTFSGGWGGTPSIIGSPQGFDSYLDSGTVAQIVAAHRK